MQTKAALIALATLFLLTGIAAAEGALELAFRGDHETSWVDIAAVPLTLEHN